MIEDFDTGRRLVLARKLRGYTQESILGEPGFPGINVKTLRRWERQGVNLTRLEEVAQFFNTEIWAFTEERLSEEDFKSLIAYPESIGHYKSRYGQQARLPASAPQVADPLKNLYRRAYFLVIEQNLVGLKALLTSQPFPIDFPNEEGWTLLMWAAHHGALPVASFLLTQGAKPGLAEKAGLTPLICAAARDHLPVIELLIPELPELNQADSAGWSALTWAAANNHPASLSALMRAGARTNQPDHRGELPLHRSLRQNFGEITQELLNPKHPHPSDPNALEATGESPLSLAVQLRQPEACRWLIQAGAKPDQVTANGLSPLERARKTANPAILSILE
ncbi:MAG: ankyrin repeat domain-containing protein [bacterium]|nr:ankyrin repeat domain-containing protein [bacterium]